MGGQGQLAAEGDAEGTLVAVTPVMPSLLPCPVHNTSEDRRGPDMWHLIPRQADWDSYGMENGRRSVHGMNLVKSALGETVLSW